MKIVYVILAHKLPEQLVRLVRRLDDDRSSFLIHFDRKASRETFMRASRPLKAYPNVHFLRRYDRYYGDYNHLWTTLIGFEEMERLRIEYDYAILLTGQDYPIRSGAEIHRALEQSNGVSYMEYFKLPSDIWKSEDGGLDRVNYWHFHIRGHFLSILKKSQRLSRFLAAISPGLTGIVPEIRRRLPADLTFYGGSAYWTLSRECVQYVTDFVRRNTALVEFFRHVLIPEEIFFQTVLLDSPLKHRVMNDNQRYISWPSGSHHPRILLRENLMEIEKSGKLFARKFDMDVDQEVMDLIDERNR